MFLDPVILVENNLLLIVVINVIFTYVTRAILKQLQKVIKKLENAQDAKNHAEPVLK